VLVALHLDLLEIGLTAPQFLQRIVSLITTITTIAAT
jgi:hypothetical protein